jgi:hypothetical protein
MLFASQQFDPANPTLQAGKAGMDRALFESCIKSDKFKLMIESGRTARKLAVYEENRRSRRKPAFT